jgi:uncharacterized membrane protein YukC
MRFSWKWIAVGLAVMLVLAVAFMALLIYGIMDFGMSVV